MKIVLFANTDWYLYNFRLSMLRTLRAAGHSLLLITPDGAYSGKLQDLGFRWVGAPMHRRSLNPLRELYLLRWLRAVLKAERPDLVHGFTIKCAIYGSLAARSAGVASVSSVAGMGYVFSSEDLKARALRPVVRKLLTLALDTESSRIILQNSDDLALFQRQRLVQAKRLRLIPSSGVDCDRFAPAASRSKNALAPIRVLLAARLLWDKGIEEYVEAGRLLRSQGYRIEMLLAGAPDPGNPASVPEKTVQSWVRDGLIQWLGHVDDMSLLFKSVDVVALPSYREGLPKGLIEAGACGCALITTDAPGCREVVTDGVDGFVVPVKDPVSLAAAIARLAEDPSLRLHLGAAAREKVLANFDERIVIERTLQVYREFAAFT